MESPQVTKSQRILLLVVCAFILPVILAKFALEQQWFNYGVTNQGKLVDGELTLSNTGIPLTQSDEKQWLLIYLMPKDCHKDCQQVLNGVNNTYIALGKEMPRVTPVGLYQQAISKQQLAQIRANDWQFMPLTNQTMKTLALNHIYIADPLGNIVLKHAIPNSAEDIPAFGKAVVADFKKLLKYSRIG